MVAFQPSPCGSDKIQNRLPFKSSCRDIDVLLDGHLLTKQGGDESGVVPFQHNPVNVFSSLFTKNFNKSRSKSRFAPMIQSSVSERHSLCVRVATQVRPSRADFVMWNWFNCYLSGRHDFGMWCEDGAVFLRCLHCGRRSTGFSVHAHKHAPRLKPPAALPAVKAESRVLPFSRAAAR
jgi:hypothetical protein